MCPRFAIRKGVKVLSRLDIMTPSRAQTVIDGLYRDVERRIAASPPGLCPVDLAMNFLNLCHAQTCFFVRKEATGEIPWPLSSL